jgi:hypothetical protein
MAAADEETLRVLRIQEFFDRGAGFLWNSERIPAWLLDHPIDLISDHSEFYAASALERYMWMRVGLELRYFSPHNDNVVRLEKVAFLNADRLRAAPAFPERFRSLVGLLTSTSVSSSLEPLNIPTGSLPSLDTFQACLMSSDLLLQSWACETLCRTLRGATPTAIDTPVDDAQMPNPTALIAILGQLPSDSEPTLELLIAGFIALLNALVSIQLLIKENDANMIGDLFSWRLDLGNKVVSKRLFNLIDLFVRMIELIRVDFDGSLDWSVEQMLRRWIAIMAFWAGFTRQTQFDVAPYEQIVDRMREVSRRHDLRRIQLRAPGLL